MSDNNQIKALLARLKKKVANKTFDSGITTLPKTGKCIAENLLKDISGGEVVVYARFEKAL